MSHCSPRPIGRAASRFALATLSAGAIALSAAGATFAQEARPATAPPSGPPAAAQTPAFDPATLPEVVARVNGTNVTRDDLLEEAKGAHAQLSEIGQAPSLDAAFYRGALDQRIASILLEGEAKNRGVAATSEEVDQRLAEARARFGSDEAFQRSLRAQGLTAEEARTELAREISRFKYIETVIVPQIQIPDDAVRRFYDQNLESMRQPERIKLRHVLIQLDAGATETDRELARRRAEDVLAKATAGGDFAALAREHSDDGTREQGGELPWVQRGQTLPAFEQAAFDLEPGKISGVVETPLGFHVIQCVDRQPARVAEFDEVKERILVLLQTEQAQHRLRETVEGLMAKADVERLAL